MRGVDIVGTSLRNLRRQKLRSALTVFAIVIGATSVTIMLALVTSAKGFFLSQLESSGMLQQVVVSQATDLDYEHARYANNTDSGVKLSDDLVARISQLPHVAAVARHASPWVFEALVYNGQKLTVQNTVANDANGVIVREMLAGRDFTPTDGVGTILVSQPYADKMGFKQRYNALVGQTVTLVTRDGFNGEGAKVQPPQNGPGNNSPGNPGGPGSQPPTEFTATILGVVADYDNALYFPLSWTRGLLTERRYEMTDAARRAAEEANRRAAPGTPPSQPQPTLVTTNGIDQRGYNSLTVKADATSHVDEVAKAIRALGVGAATAQSMVAEQLKVFQILGLVLGAIGGIALVVAAIGVINTMLMAIFERTREIGVMRACGATRAAVRRLFTVEAGLLGFLGGLAGVAVGYGLSLVANVIVNGQLSANSVQARDIIVLPPWLILAVVSTTTLIGALAGLYPAVRASRLNPVEALRYE